MTDTHPQDKSAVLTTLTALRLIDSLNQLREDIAIQGAMIESIDVAMTALYSELHSYNQARRMHGTI